MEIWQMLLLALVAINTAANCYRLLLELDR